MTAYEIADIRAAIGLRVATLQSSFFALSLAMFAGTYATAGKLDMFSLSALILFHAYMSFAYVRLSVLAFDQIGALQRDADKLAERTGERAEILGDGMLLPPTNVRRGPITIYVVVSVAFAAYVLKQAGLFG